MVLVFSFLVCIKHTSPEQRRRGREIRAIVVSLKARGGPCPGTHSCPDSLLPFLLLESLPAVLFLCMPLRQEDQGATSEELKLQTAFSKNNKGGRKKRQPFVSESLSPIKEHEMRHCGGESNLREHRSPSLSLDRGGN